MHNWGIIAQMNLSRQKIFIISVGILTFGFLSSQIYLQRELFSTLGENLVDYRQASLVITPAPTLKPEPTLKPSNTDILEETLSQKPINPRPTDSQPWGVAQKVDDLTYTIKVGEDPVMATPQEVLNALNNYRNVNGKSSLTWDDNLASYAQSRANHFSAISGTDKHAGFDNYLNNEDGFSKLGFRRVGENSYFGGKLNGVHMIEWVFAKSPGHNANQLDSQWTHVGIGVTNNSANLNFGGERM